MTEAVACSTGSSWYLITKVNVRAATIDAYNAGESTVQSSIIVRYICVGY